MGAENQKMKRKFFCFGCRRSEAKAGGNANRKLLVGITTRAAREKLIIKILRILLEKGSDFIQEPQHFFKFGFLPTITPAYGGNGRRAKRAKVVPPNDFPRFAWKINNFFVLENRVRFKLF